MIHSPPSWGRFSASYRCIFLIRDSFKAKEYIYWFLSTGTYLLTAVWLVLIKLSESKSQLGPRRCSNWWFRLLTKTSRYEIMAAHAARACERLSILQIHESVLCPLYLPQNKGHFMGRALIPQPACGRGSVIPNYLTRLLEHEKQFLPLNYVLEVYVDRYCMGSSVSLIMSFNTSSPTVQSVLVCPCYQQQQVNGRGKNIDRKS